QIGLTNGGILRGRLEVSTNLIDWTHVQNGGAVPNEITFFPDPLPGYGGPRFFRAVNARETCRSNLLLIAHAKAAWSFEMKKGPSDTQADTDLFGPRRYLPASTLCPDAGLYSLNDAQMKPTRPVSTAG